MNENFTFSRAVLSDVVLYKTIPRVHGFIYIKSKENVNFSCTVGNPSKITKNFTSSGAVLSDVGLNKTIPEYMDLYLL